MVNEQTLTDSKSDYLPFIDWMKFIGMAFIVYGHSPGGLLWRATDPFNMKQIGVVCFVFATGVSLARETRPAMRVLFARLFEMYAVGILFSIVLSAVVYVAIGDLTLSNYMPYVLGVNVFVDWFPANPTTWYIGMYLHLLVIWAVFLRRFKIRGWMILASVLMEIPIRVFLMRNAGDYIAYMMVSNWLSILLLGMWIGQGAINVRIDYPKALAFALVTVLALLAWPKLLQLFDLRVGAYSFPFMRFIVNGQAAPLLVTSAAVTFLYLFYLYVLYQCFLRLPAGRFVKFCARNTVFVFIVHIPLVYAFKLPFYDAVDSILLRVVLSLAGYYLLLALISELLFHRLRLLDGLRRLSETVMSTVLGKFKVAF